LHAQGSPCSQPAAGDTGRAVAHAIREPQSTTMSHTHRIAAIQPCGLPPASECIREGWRSPACLPSTLTRRPGQPSEARMPPGGPEDPH